MSGSQRHERDDSLPFQIVRTTNDGGLSDCVVADERTFDFHCSNAMSGNVDDVVNATHDPKVPIFITTSSVAGEVHAWNFAPVLPFVSFGIAVDRAHHRRPRFLDDEK